MKIPWKVVTFEMHGQTVTQIHDADGLQIATVHAWGNRKIAEKRAELMAQAHLIPALINAVNIARNTINGSSPLNPEVVLILLDKTLDSLEL